MVSFLLKFGNRHVFLSVDNTRLPWHLEEKSIEILKKMFISQVVMWWSSAWLDKRDSNQTFPGMSPANSDIGFGF